MIGFVLSFILNITTILLYKWGGIGEITFFITALTLSTHMAVQAFYGLPGKTQKGEENAETKKKCRDQ